MFINSVVGNKLHILNITMGGNAVPVSIFLTERLDEWLPVWIRMIPMFAVPVCLVGAFFGMLVVGATSWSSSSDEPSGEA